MLVSINAVTIPNTEDEEQMILIHANDVESFIMSDDLFETAEAEEVVFRFDKTSSGHRKYLYKLMKSNRATKDKDSIGAMLQALPGQIISLSTSFLVR